MEINGKYANAKVFAITIEPECINQVHSMMSSPALKNDVRIMPDAHAGKGSVVGFTMRMGDKVIPNIIGVDIGCGMSTMVYDKIDLCDNYLSDLDMFIRGSIPLGMNTRGFSYHKNLNSVFEYDAMNKALRHFVDKFNAEHGTKFIATEYDEDYVNEVMERVGISASVFSKSIGTLGGGNHFIEMGTDNSRRLYLTVHSGSRNFGLKVANYWQGVAKAKVKHLSKEDVAKIVSDAKSKEDIGKLISDASNARERAMPGMEWLEKDDLLGYVKDMIFAQGYAMLNRMTMHQVMNKYICSHHVDYIETVHNYINFADMVIRKGAVQSYEGQKLVIPMNMRDGILVCTGKSNKDWNYSAPHGAGRLCSRTKAKELFDMDDYRKSMIGICTTSVCEGTLDESPMTYKPMEEILMAIEDTVDVIDIVKPIYNIKASE
jgi:RNA-splicing ligase RtcB